MLITPSFIKKPCIQAFVVVAVYLAMTSFIMLGANELFIMAADNMKELHILDGVKDILLILLTAVLLFLISFLMFRRILKQSFALMASERRAMAGMLSLAVIHDFNNLLTIADGNAALLERKAKELVPKNREFLSRLQKALSNLGQISNRIKSAGKLTMANDKQRIVLGQLVEGVIKLLQSHGKLKTCHLDFASGAPSLVFGIPSMIQDAVINIVLNAADATGHDGKILVEVFEQEGMAIIDIQDNGPGISKELEEQVFETFYSTKSDGTGLGLPSVRACADAHNGRVTVKDADLGGASIRLEIPTMERRGGGVNQRR